MPLNFEYFSAAGNTTAAGVFLPVASLWNVQDSELASNAADRESRVIFGILEKLCNPNGQFATLQNKLGVSSSYGTPTGVGTNLINQTYTLTAQYFANLATNTIQPIPVPTSGNNSGRGGVKIVDVFAGATKLAASADTEGAGVLIPSSELTPYGGPSHASIDVNQDSRAWFNALFLYLADKATVRSNNTASAVVAVNPVLTVTGALPSGALVAPSNPTSGIDPTKQVTNVLITRSVSVTLQLLVDTQNETIRPNHVVA
jgi:hypothetical protein